MIRSDRGDRADRADRAADKVDITQSCFFFLFI